MLATRDGAARKHGTFMQDVEAHAQRVRKNRFLALVLFMASLGVLGLMLTVVFLTRTGVLSRFLSHLGQLY